MKKQLAFVAMCLLFSVCTQGQTQIATSKCIDATANRNQRKIVRDTLDNVYVVYHDSLDGNMVVKGLFLNRETETWSEPAVICNGKNPTIAISRDCKFFLIYETDDIVPKIAYISSFDFVFFGLPEPLPFLGDLPLIDSMFIPKLYLLYLFTNLFH